MGRDPQPVGLCRGDTLDSVAAFQIAWSLCGGFSFNCRIFVGTVGSVMGACARYFTPAQAVKMPLAVLGTGLLLVGILFRSRVAAGLGQE